MYRHAANLAAQPNSSLNAPRVLIASFRRHNEHRSIPSSREALTRQGWAAIWRNYCRREAKAAFSALRVFPPRIPSSTRGHASGPSRRPAARRRSASLLAPLRGLGSSQNKFESSGKERRSNFFRAPPRKHSLALGSRALSLGFA